MDRTFALRLERPEDIPAIAALYDDAFGADEPIADLVQCLRDLEADLPTVSLLAETRDTQIVGHLMLSHAWLDAPAKLFDVMVLSPLGVRTDFQGQGIGTALIDLAFKAAEAAGTSLLFLEGDPKFYGPRGFAAAGDLGFHRPSRRIPWAAFQVRKLAGYRPEMTGTLVYRDVFWALDCVGLRD